MGKAIYMPVTPSLVRWARTEAGWGIEELAERLEIPLELLAAWESGDAQPNTTQLKRLAGALRRPTAVFFLPEAPASDAVTPMFRAALGATANREPTADERDAIRTAQRLQRVTAWIGQRSTTPPVTLPDAREMSPTAAADQARERVGWTVDEQWQTRDARHHALALRDVLQAAGILVLNLPLGERGARGFAMWHEDAPLICINTELVQVARVFTTIHELGHLVRRDTSITTGFRTTSEERWCEQFAASFLLPEDAVKEAMRGLAIDEAQRFEDVERLALRFRVSLRAAAVRLIHLRLAPQRLYGEVDAIAEYRGKRKGGGGGPRRPLKRLREYGRLYTARLEEAQERGLLSRYDVLTYLDVSDSEWEEVRSLARVGAT
jgi:Zn-dependent peptidase ImmA (M78 family)/transcriptional regulator with XRE-family HTH domain